MTKYNSKKGSSIFSGVDWVTVMIYLLLVMAGWVTIFAAVYSEENSNIFDISMQYGAQMIWIAASLVVALGIILTDDHHIYTFSYPLYALTMLTLIAVLLFGTEVNGARSWFQIGPFRLQPAEFAKFTTGLALARYISNYQFNVHRFKDIAAVFAIALTPALIILVQNDAGSALVYSSFLIMFYREGFASWVYVALIIVVSVIISSFIFESWLILLVLILLLFLLESLSDNKIWIRLSYLATMMLTWVVIAIIDFFADGIDISSEYALLFSFLLTSPIPIIYSIKNRKSEILGYISLLFISTILLFSVDYIFNNVMKLHQQKRILDTLGLENDTRGWGYNVNQSKIAIGSGGLFGKGYLKGTQTKYDFVPEQSTDFIFCTIGEEWGFVGCVTIIILFIVLIIRLMRMGDNQKESFGRIYCYFVASVLLFHVVINIGMTIGLMPVIGIPLPFFSYGGSSLIAFTILLFIAIRLDSRNSEQIKF